MIIQFGYPPNRIDFLNTISGVTFGEAWKGRISESLLIRGQTIAVCYIGLAALIKNKKAVGRPKDLEDLKYLLEAAKRK
jgi:hypothetical protein